MGHEIRRVPADWQHPHDERGRCLPLRAGDYAADAAEWTRRFLDWEAGGETRRQALGYFQFFSPAPPRYFWEYAGPPPDRQSYMPDWPEEVRTHFQVYETFADVPSSPVLPSREAVRSWCLSEGWPAESAAEFAEHGWRPNAVIAFQPRKSGEQGEQSERD